MAAIPLTYQTVKLGELVDVQEEFGWSRSVKIHYFNRKGVLVGRKYEFISWDRVYRRRPSKPLFATNVNWFMRLNFSFREYLIRKAYKKQKLN